MSSPAVARVAAVVDQLAPELIAFRRDLHAHPEPSWEEHRTTRLLLDRLRLAGLDPHVAPTPSGTGVICDIGSGGPMVAVRGDIDALRLHDTKEVPYRSTVEGVCHACGHDLHATAALGAGLALAEAMAERAAPGRVRIILQPAEEAVPGGALSLLGAGVVDDVEAVFALHADPSRAVGCLGISAGPVTSAADQLNIKLYGPGGHTGRPHESVDLAHLAARVALELPMSLNRLSDPRDGLNLTFGAIQVGDAPNVIATEAHLMASLRATGRGAWARPPTHLERIVASIVEPLGATWELDHRRGAPPVVNDPWAAAIAAAAAGEVVGEERVGTTEQSAGGEDFSWYGEKARLGYLRLGVWDPARLRTDLHAGGFDLDESAIAIGAKVLAGTALRALDDLTDA